MADEQKATEQAVADEVRIHYLIPGRLHRMAKAAAAISGSTLKDFIIGTLWDRVRKSKVGSQAGPNTQPKPLVEPKA